MPVSPRRVLTSCITAAQQCTDDIVATVTIGDTILGLPLSDPKHPFAPPAGTSARCRSTLARERDPCTTPSRPGDIVQELAAGAAADSGYRGSVRTAVVLGHLFCTLFGASPLTRSENELKYRWSGHGHA